MQTTIGRTHVATAILIILTATGALARVDSYHFTGINFNFTNPGARARGIGGAYVALADDATASLANPAGLAYLDRQFSLEVIRDEEQAPVGQKTQGGVLIEGNRPNVTFTALNDPFRVTAESESTRINHASMVIPIPSLNIGIAAYYASLANLSQQYDVGAGMVCFDNNNSPYSPNGGDSCSGQQGILYSPQSVVADLETQLLGAGFGWEISDSFSIGASISYVTTELQGISDVIGQQDDEGNPITLDTTWLSSVDDSDLMYALGVLYRASKWGFGLSYRSETSFETANNIADANGEIDRSFAGEFRIPARLSAGLAFFPSDTWVVSLEYVNIPYSTMPEGMPNQFDQIRQSAGVSYDSADVDEYHIGAEWTTFGDGKGWSVRFGYWRDQTHLIYSSQGYPDPAGDFDGRTQAEAAFLYPELNLDFDHFTTGVGALFGSFRLDFAVDYSNDAGTDALLSGVFYF